MAPKTEVPTLSGLDRKALLDKLYGGLDTMPAIEAEMDARDQRGRAAGRVGMRTDV